MHRLLAFPGPSKLQNDKLALFRVVRCPTLLVKRPRDEAWRRLSQILKNVIASDADATVKLYFLCSRFSNILFDATSFLFRNLVTSLIQHEQVKTTLPKARDAARLAEKVVLLFPSPHRF